MNSQSFNSKKYVLTFFMSTCLLTSSFLSMEARAGSLATMRTKAAEWRKKGDHFNIHEAAQKLNLTVIETKTIQDIKTKKDKHIPSSRLFTPADLKSNDTKERSTARNQNAKLEIFKTLIEQPNLEQTIENQIKANSFLEFKQPILGRFDTQNAAYNYYSSKPELTELLKKASEILGRKFDLKDLKAQDEGKRHEAKNELVILEEYIKMVNYASLDAQKAQWVKTNHIPEKKDFDKFSFLKSFDIKGITEEVKSEINPLQKNPNSKIGQNKRNAFLSGIRSMMRPTSQQDPDNSTTPSQTVKLLAEMANNNATQGSDDRASTSSKAPAKPNKLKQEKKSFDFRGSVTSLIGKKKPDEQLNIIGRNLKRHKDISEFTEFLEDNKPIEALEFAEKRKLGDLYKKQAISAINLDNDDIIKTIFFTVDNTGARTILNAVLTNSSPEEKTKFVERIKDYATQNISNSQFEEKTRLDLIRLAASKNKSSVEKFLALQLELKNKMQPYFTQSTYNLTPEIVKEINTELKNEGLVIDSLTEKDMIKLVKEVNQRTLDSVIKVILSDSNVLSNETNKILGLAVVNNANNLNQKQGGIPNPPPPPPGGSIPPPPPPLSSNSNNFDLNKLQAEHPRVYSLYNQLYINNNTTKSEVPLQHSPSNTSTTATERSIPETAYAKIYAKYRAETNLNSKTKETSKKANDLQSQIIKRTDDIANVIRQILTKSYSDQGADTETLITLFSQPTSEIEKKAKEVFNTLAQDSYIQDIIADGNKTKIATRTNILGTLFNESKEDARERLLLSSSKVKEQHRKEIILYNTMTSFNAITGPLEKLIYAQKYKNILGENVFNNTFDELIANPKILTFSDQIHFLTQNYEGLNISDEQKKAIRDRILSTIEIKDLATDTQTSPQNLVNVIKQKDLTLLLKLLEATVTIAENQLTNLKSVTELDNELTILLSGMNACPEDLKILANKMTVDGIKGTLRDKWEQENKAKANNTQKPPVDNNGIPMPPPIPNGNTNFGANDYLTTNRVSQHLIDRINKLPKSKFSATNTSAEKFEGSIKSQIGAKYYAASRASGGKLFTLSHTQKLDTLIKEEITDQYLNNINKKLEKLDSSIVQEAFDIAHSDFIGLRTELGQEIHHKLFSDAIQEAFDNAHSDFIGPRTELGQEIHELYEQELLKLARDSVFIIEYVKNNKYIQKDEREQLISFIEQIESKHPELEQKYGSDTQSESEDKKESLVDRMKKRFQQENETKNDESSTEDDKKTNDKELGTSDLKTTLSTNLSNSNNNENAESSDNKKSLLALRASNEEDEGYKTDEEELDESNNTTEEELKKDMLLESEDKAIDVPLKTEEIVEQDEEAQRQQVSDETIKKAALLNAASTFHKQVHPSILTNRLNVAAIGAGDEDTSIITRGLWISGLYGINKQGAWKNIPKYQGRTTGVTIGLDAEFINSHDIIGIAYSRLESQVKYNKKLGKTAVNGHLFSLYGLKELVKGFSLQAITSYGHNYIKNKTTSINNIIGKYQNNNVSFETLLNYKYRTKHDLHFIPSIGFKYDYSRASNYKEYNVDIENLMIQKKSNQSFESSLGGKIVFKPIATVSNIVLTPSLHGNIEHHFNNKNTKVNAKATFKGQTLQQTIILPKQPKLGYNIGSNILMSRKNINVLLEYNYYTHRKYQSHQGLMKLKVNL